MYLRGVVYSLGDMAGYGRGPVDQLLKDAVSRLMQMNKSRERKGPDRIR